MKKLFTLLLFVPALSFAQENKDTVGLNIPLKDGAIVYEQVVEMPGRSKDELYKNSKQWFVEYFKSSKEVIQNDDKNDGKIIGKGFVYYYSGKGLTASRNLATITVQIDCRDNKYRYKIYGISAIIDVISPPQTVPIELYVNKLSGIKPDAAATKGIAKKTLEAIILPVNETIASIKSAMAKKPDDF